MSLGQKAANHLKALRLFNKLGTEEFAKRIGVARQLLTRWESGKAIMSMKSYDDACAALDLPPAEFICGPAEIELKRPAQE